LANAIDSSTGVILYFSAILKYSSAAKVEDLELYLVKYPSYSFSLEFFGFVLFLYFPVKVPNARGEYAIKLVFSLIEISAKSFSNDLFSKL